LGRPLFIFGHVNGDPFDNKASPAQRTKLWATIRNTPALVWLILTKRPQNFRKMLPADWGAGYPNVWLGVSAESQREADRRLPLLCRTPATRRWVSAEPLLEAVDLSPWLGPVSWVVGGCESDNGRPGKRPTDLAWLRSLRDQCEAARVAFWLKQMVVDGKLVELPELDGTVWAQRPQACDKPAESRGQLELPLGPDLMVKP
jgi:protein gp37